ncbi:GNAT family N-acetyltransferase [Enterococcus plantarum]|uniref:GNAT family N-acetyltransferase n=1 Tax=Enterococcus plantarum TaxID=1077675 RepID=UPI001A8E7D4D|nr:GNAT family N-acetyltransferase [Enterococcus plantarum]MBO0468441.1 GNAT family N-acetyltransferase [Enterococcus plantarum]
MTIKLQEMTEADYEKYITFAIKDYAHDKITAGTWSKNEAIDLAAKSFNELLPEGKETKNEFLYSIEEESIDKKVGFLWVHLNKTPYDSKFFIYDFIVFEEFRGIGYGKETLSCLDEKAKEMNVSQIDLHVFAHNKGAIHLYEQTGFVPTDISMSKKIG